ncbi:unnamed protein product [Lymnaea stagnalis]|uniref:Uncharacterized protein n=1 Tax=Lymnaea stagnalis TaxID=6523 RepID=A0AAV2IN66_LYMST
MSKAGSVCERRGDLSLDSSFTGTSAKLKLGRFRWKMRGMLSNLGSSTVVTNQQPVVAYENTYKMAPDDGKRFSIKRAEEVIDGVFNHYLHGKSYDSKVFPRLIKTLTELIRDRVKTQGMERYKILATVTVIENKEQGVHLASRALWNQHLDNFASLSYEGPDYYAVGSVYAIYHD